MCVDLCAVDYLLKPTVGCRGVEPERFEVVVQPASLAERKRARLRVQVPAATPRSRRCRRVSRHRGMGARGYDMFGVVFTGIPI